MNGDFYFFSDLSLSISLTAIFAQCLYEISRELAYLLLEVLIRLFTEGLFTGVARSVNWRGLASFPFPGLFLFFRFLPFFFSFFSTPYRLSIFSLLFSPFLPSEIGPPKIQLEGPGSAVSGAPAENKFGSLWL